MCIIYIFLLAFPVLLQGQGVSWKNLVRSPYEFSFRAVASSDERFVAIGESSIKWTSTDGLHWQAQSKAPTTHYGITYGNSRFIAGGFRGSLIVSTDGITWVSKSSGVTTNIKDIVYAADKNWFVGIAALGQLTVSKDGGNTFSGKVVSGAGFNGITYGNGLFVAACGNGYVYTSTDAVNWSSQKIGDQHLMCAAYGNVSGTHTYVVGGRRGYIHSSTDGSTWQLRKSSGTYLYGATYTGNYFILVGQPPSGGKAPLFTSTDGANWASRDSKSTNPLFGVDYKSSSNRVVALGQWRIVISDNTPSSITVTDPYKLPFPNKMELLKGSNHTITWRTTGTVGNVKIEYSTNGVPGPYTVITDSIAASTGAIAWTVPNVQTDYGVIRIKETDADPLAYSESFKIVSIVGAGTITITSPNGGESWQAGTTKNITWTGSTNFSKIDLEYYTGSQWKVIVNGTADDGSYSWLVPNISTTQAQIWIKGYDGSTNPTDYSNNTFTITTGTPASITLNSPNGGENWVGGSNHNITWTGYKTFSKIDIEYHDGTKWNVIVNGTTDDGSYAWTVANISTTQAQIWIKGFDGGTNPTDYSDNLFTISLGSTDTITVTSPNGGEELEAGTSQNISWVTAGTVGNVKIEYSTSGGSSWTTVTSATANDGNYSWSVPNTPSSQCLVRLSEASDGSPSDNSNTHFTIIEPLAKDPPEIVLDRMQLNFGYIKGKAATCSQELFISNGGDEPLNWTAAADGWINLNPASGGDGAVVTVSVDPSGLNAGTYTGAITVSDPNATNSPQTVTVKLNVKNSGQDESPFGDFATPLDGTSGVTGSVAVTGWALDDTCVTGVKIYREVNGGLSYIGDAVFVEGARPDVEGAYPDYPNNSRAGWGYMMLTNFLDEGKLILKAIATDSSGTAVELGTKTITIDNGGAQEPFGAIDTPTQGGEASGSNFRNSGWALTPQPNKIPEDGSTINVYIDGIPVGKANYNLYRADIATLFPGYANSNGSRAYFDFDTTAYSNGVHTISWGVADNAGNSDGIGSRFFTILNSNGGARSQAQSAERRAPGTRRIPEIHAAPVNHFEPLSFKKGYNEYIKPGKIYPDKQGVIHLEIKELERFMLQPNGYSKFYTGYLVVNGQLRSLPIGSKIDANTGIFYWQAGPGFIGEYEFVFFAQDQRGSIAKTHILVKIGPKFSK